MSFIEEQRKQVLEDNNIAQSDFLDFLENLPLDTSVINVNIPLSGDIDGEVLTKCSFKGIHAITFVDGKITSLKNIPEGVTKFHCVGNYLKDLPVLPNSVVDLDLHKNTIKIVNGPWPNDLKELNLSENNIYSLEELPKGLEVLNIDNCGLRVLKLDGILNLRVLHCSGNPGLIIENIPDTLTDLQMDNDVITEVNKLRNEYDKEKDLPEKYANFQDSLQTYFEMKNTYNTRVLKIKRETYKSSKTKKERKIKLKALKPKCIACNRPVGSVFENKGRKFIARCGDTVNPCPLNIELFGGEYENISDTIPIYDGILKYIKQNIIKDKLDVVFQYISEDDGIVYFKDNLDNYTTENHHFETLKKENDNLYFDEEQTEKLSIKKKKISQIKERIQQMTDTYNIEENPQILKDIMTVYIQELMPEINNNALIKYQTREIDLDIKTNQYKLFQKHWRINQLEYTFGEYPRVIHFRVK